MKTNVFTILGVAVFFLIVASVIFSFVKSDSGEIGIANSTIKSYDPITKTATLNSVEDDTIAIVQLKSNLNEQVGLGYQKVFEYEIDSKTNYDNFIQEIEIYNIKNGNTKENKQIDLKYLTYEEYEVNDYEESCSLNKNGTNECTNKIIGTHKEQQEVWNDLSSMNVKAEKIVISGWTDVKQGDNYEWIPTFAGTKVNEWATWVQSSGTKTYTDIGGVNYTVLTYNSNGTFNHTGTSNLNVSILVIAGGGGGGAGQYIGAGGGAGGLIYNESFDIIPSNFNIVIGTGGAGGAVSNSGTNGINSSFSFSNGTKVKEARGGGGAIGYGQTTNADGGSGGGTTDTASDLGGLGTAGQGYDGGNFDPVGANAGAGGGGAGSVGLPNVATTGGNGGTGKTYSINGTSTCYAGGGGGASNGGVQGVGTCGGGSGTTSEGTSGINGTGGGGGGGERLGTKTGGRGGDGVVIIRYLTSDAEVKVNEWATWTGNLSVGLITYYKLDETTGAVKDERNLNNGTAYVTRGVTGKLGTAYNFTDTSAEKVFSSNPTGLNGVGLSGTLWIYALSQNSGSLVFIDGNGDESMNFGFTGSQIKMNCWDTGQSYNTGYDATSYLNKWTFVYWEMNSTRTRVYLDGTLVIDTSGAFTGFSSSVVNLSLGSAFYSPDIVPNSIIDEVGIWNRTLTTQEQGYLYNAGNGCTYNNENCFVPPTSAFCNFTGYVKDSAGNGLNGANVIIINQTDNKMYYNVTSDANGFWSKNITNSNGTSSSQLYTVLAYFNNSLVGGIKPYVNSTCP